MLCEAAVMTRKKARSDSAAALLLRSELDRTQAALEAMKVAYFNRSTFGDSIPDEHAVKRAAEDFVRANHAYQRLLYGRVRVTLSAADLLR